MTRPWATGAWTRLRAHWTAGPARRRRLLTAGLTLAVLLLLWSFVWLPAWRQLRDGPARQARLLAAIGAVQRDAAALAALRRLPDAGATNQTAESLSAVLHARSQHWLGTTARSAAVGDGWEVAFDGASSAGLAAWLADLRQTMGLIPVHLQWERDPNTGNWRGSARLMAAGGVP